VCMCMCLSSSRACSAVCCGVLQCVAVCCGVLQCSGSAPDLYINACVRARLRLCVCMCVCV